MDSNITKKILIIMAIVFVIIVILFIILFINNKKIVEDKDYNPDYDPDYTIGVEGRIQNRVQIDEEYYSIRDCINNYYKYIKSFEQENTKSIINLLEKQYIQEFNINENNLKNIISYNYNINYIINDMYVYDLNDEIAIYVVLGKELNNTNSKLNNFIVKVDRKNNTFSLFLNNYFEKYNYTTASNIKTDLISKDYIEKNSNNGFEFLNILDNQYLTEQLLNDYKIRLLSDTKGAYDLLDKDYQKKRFPTYGDFESFVKEQNNKIRNSLINKYKINLLDNSKQVICLDNYGSYYIFNKISPTDYTVILDYYTVDIEEFSKKLNTTKTSDKIALNVTKFLDMINYSDYTSAYDMLDETFRNNKFGNINSFINYVQKTFFAINKADLSNFKEQGGVYTIEANIQNYTTYIENSKTNVISKTFIVKINDDGTCTMSFNIE
ncbi:MAG: hypothetical protein IJH76_03095 [Clostridia bacterium]|nr:hypothetical protein [Bacilli bacterium]MBR0350794.1 hypothetical protein [Clostridia bacterium]